MSGPFSILRAVPCEMEEECTASPNTKGEAGAFCPDCRWSPFNDGEGKDGFRARSGSRAIFRRRESWLHDVRRKKVDDRNSARKLKSSDKKRLARKAELAERATERQQIRATKNSGRVNRDGDHVSAGVVTLDTKLQTGNTNPVIQLSELDKVRIDAKRAGNPIGGLVLRNKNNRGVVVFSEDDWAIIANWLTRL